MAIAGAGVHAAPARHDLGDAPDGAPAGYAARPELSGAFPSKAASSGPRHRRGGVRIGDGWTSEPDSRQADRDLDDGAMLRPRARGLSTLTVVVDARRLPSGAFARDSKVRIWVNAWFDWNGDGDWRDGRAGARSPEWGVQNLAIEPRALGPVRIATVPIRFRTGAVPTEFWWRVQVHAGDRAPHAGGAGAAAPYADGETEDYFHRVLPPTAEPPPPSGGGVALPRLDCGPRTIVEHGGHADVVARVVGVTRAPGQTLVLDRSRLVRVAGDLDGVRVTQTGFSHPKGWVRVEVRSLKRHARRPFLQKLTVHLAATAITNGSERYAVTAACPVLVDHAPTLAPRRARQPQAGSAAPPPRGGAPPDGGSAGRPDPVTARCRASVVVSGAAAVSIRCDGVDVRSSSAFTTLSEIASVREAGSPARAIACAVEDERRVARCLWRAPNRARALRFEYTALREIRSVRLYVLAGGREGEKGTAVVLLQDRIFGSRGVTCVQSVPKADACATLG